MPGNIIINNFILIIVLLDISPAKPLKFKGYKFKVLVRWQKIINIRLNHKKKIILMI